MQPSAVAPTAESLSPASVASTAVVELQLPATAFPAQQSYLLLLPAAPLAAHLRVLLSSAAQWLQRRRRWRWSFLSAAVSELPCTAAPEPHRAVLPVLVPHPSADVGGQLRLLFGLYSLHYRSDFSLILFPLNHPPPPPKKKDKTKKIKIKEIENNCGKLADLQVAGVVILKEKR